MADISNWSSASAGVFQASVFRGRELSAAATAAISSLLCVLRSVPFGKYWRSSPLVFSLVPRCQDDRRRGDRCRRQTDLFVPRSNVRINPLQAGCDIAICCRWRICSARQGTDAHETDPPLIRRCDPCCASSIGCRDRAQQRWPADRRAHSRYRHHRRLLKAACVALPANIRKPAPI
jgi:hypothetical protein